MVNVIYFVVTRVRLSTVCECVCHKRVEQFLYTFPNHLLYFTISSLDGLRFSKIFGSILFETEHEPQRAPTQSWFTCTNQTAAFTPNNDKRFSDTKAERQQKLNCCV